MTEREIKAEYKVRHDDLTERYYKKHELTKEEFDTQHGQIWGDMDAELTAKGFMEQPQQPRDLEAEIDELRSRLATLEK